MAGPRPIWKRAEKVKKNARLYIVGHDQIKTMVMERLALDPFAVEGQIDPHAVRLSEDLPEEWFEQATGEVRRIRYVKNRPIIEFMPKREGQRVEALDCLCYGWAVRYSRASKSLIWSSGRSVLLSKARNRRSAAQKIGRLRLMDRRAANDRRAGQDRSTGRAKHSRYHVTALERNSARFLPRTPRFCRSGRRTLSPKSHHKNETRSRANLRVRCSGVEP